MGLDATVYCNCYEVGRVRRPPPRPELVYLDEDGSIGCRDGGDDVLYFEFIAWLHDACEHEDGILLHHRIGNIALVALLREQLRREGARFPILLGSVLYDGIHSGDFLNVSAVASIAEELTLLADFHGTDRKAEAFIRDFETQMKELVLASRRVGKPVVF